MTGRQKDFEISLKKREEYNARAQKIVCELIYGAETEAEFLEKLRWVNVNHYQDVVEERAISKVCGYPVCEEELNIIPRKKYHVSVSRNKVYDVTERKLFCSNQCYKASLYLKMQLHTSPLWMGNREECQTFSLLKNQTELLGQEINFGIERVKVPVNLESESESTNACEVNHVEPMSHTSYTLQEDLEFYAGDDSNSDDGDKNEFDGEKLKSSLKLEKNSSKKELCDAERKENHSESHLEPNTNEKDSPSKSVPRIHVDPDESFTVSNCYAPEMSKSVNTATTNLKKTKIPSPTIAELVHHVEMSMREWITIDSLRIIIGDRAIKMWRENSCLFDSNHLQNDPSLHERYNALCKKLNILELDEERETECEPPSKSLPDFEILRKQTEEIEMQVKAFYRGDKKVTFDENKEDAAEVDDSVPIVLPTIHHYAQNAIRRNIVLNKLNFILPDLCDMFALNRVHTSSKVKQLARTCRFSAHNISFKPLEWNLIGLILLKLLSVQDHHVHTSIQSKSKLVTAVLMSYQLEPNYLDLLTTWLTNPEFILKNDTAS